MRNEMRKQNRERKGLVSTLREFGTEFGKSFANFSTMPYRFPTVNREDREGTIMEEEKLSEYMSKTNAEFYGEVTGTILGASVGITQLPVYGFLTMNGSPEILIIPTVTNLASLIYEKKRKTPKKVTDKLRRMDQMAETLEIIYKIKAEKVMKGGNEKND